MHAEARVSVQQQCSCRAYFLDQAVLLLFAADPDHRPSMHSIMVHPLWWPPPQRLAFLIAVSDRVEGEDRAVRTATAFAFAGRGYGVGVGAKKDL